MRRAELMVAVGCLFVSQVGATPLDDLRSPAQQVRDATAALLRGSFVPPARSRWEPLVVELRAAYSKDLVLQMLQPYAVAMEGGMGGGGSSTEFYRLDDLWLLQCSFGRFSEALGCDLTEHMRSVWVAPPSDFNGTWTTYFVNGQRSHEINYRNGQYFGTVTSFHSNGSKAVVQHYGAEGADGEDTGYFPSGALSYKGRYSKNEPTGTWVWYNEDGSVRSTRENPQ